jgi:hypothetical protein
MIHCIGSARAVGPFDELWADPQLRRSLFSETAARHDDTEWMMKTKRPLLAEWPFCLCDGSGLFHSDVSDTVNLNVCRVDGVVAETMYAW